MGDAVDIRPGATSLPIAGRLSAITTGLNRRTNNQIQPLRIIMFRVIQDDIYG
jgi:hypothetical protein